MRDGPVEPHHLKAVGMGRNRKKEMARHYTCIPVCRPCHMDYHNIGIKDFEKKHGISVYKVNHRYLVAYILANLEGREWMEI
tara:strand:- start:5382 stop:5627 length:246 start_codon:yes stop_codon:yes gene_type:complete